MRSSKIEHHTVFIAQLTFSSLRAKDTQARPKSEEAMIWYYTGKIPGNFSYGYEDAYIGHKEFCLGLTPADVEYLERAERALIKYADVVSLETAPHLGRRMNEWPRLGSADSDGIYVRSTSLLIGLAAAGIIYGAMHLLAWSAPFASNAEAVVWRLSAIILIASGPAFALTTVFKIYKEEVDLGFFISMFLGCTYAVCWAFLLLYILARIFLVVECFLELQHLPEKVFLTPKWTKYWPHIG